MNFDDVQWIAPGHKARLTGMKVRVGKNAVWLSRELGALMQGRTFRAGYRKQDGKLIVIIQPTEGKGHNAHMNRGGAWLGASSLVNELAQQGAHDKWISAQVMRAGGEVSSVRFEYDLPDPLARGGAGA